MNILSKVQATDLHSNSLAGYALIFLGVLSLIFLVFTIFNLVIRTQEKKAGKKPDGFATTLTVVLCLVTCILIALSGLFAYSWLDGQKSSDEPIPVATIPTAAPTEAIPAATTTPTETVPPTTAETVPPTEPDPIDLFKPHHTANSDPANWGINWEIIVADQVVESYTREDPIFFGEPSEYFSLEGVSTFRGNNYRNEAAYGTADLDNEGISYLWSTHNGSLDGWPGCGWTGQPQIVKWDEQTKANMTTMYERAREKEDLVEVIYATLDGYIYFLDLDDGTWTRDPIEVGMNMKGSGTLDPRGYPLLYVGSGNVLYGSYKPRMYIVSLIDGEILYEAGYNDSMAPRYWSGFDSAPLVDAETDTLIWPGENGLLYTIDLNTQYDPEAGTISVNPTNAALARYSTARSVNDTYWVGMEDSCCVVGGYLFVADNSGMFFCVDLNTMELIWAQDIKDDTNASPVFEWGEDGNGYLYIAPSLHWTDDWGWGDISIYKLDAQTGEIIWEKPYHCGTVEDLSGGVQATPALGRTGTNLEGMVFFSVSYTPKMHTGILVALDTETGEVVWEKELSYYAWSSPVAVYNESNEGYLLMPCFEGELLLIDGATGEVVDAVDLDSHTEASPVVYGSTVVIGTRGCEIYGLELY